MKKKIDNTLLGAIFGFLVPVITLMTFMLLKFDGTFNEFIKYLSANKAYRNDPLILAMLPNLVMFYFSNFQFRWDKFTIGLVAATLIYSIPIVISLI